MALERPNAHESESELLAACFKGEGATYTKEDVVKLLVTETVPDMYVHPHHQKIFIAMQEAVMDSPNQDIGWGEVRSNIDQESAARGTLKRLVTEKQIPPVSKKWAEKNVKKLGDTFKCRKILQMQESVKLRAQAGDADSAFDDLMESVFSLGRDQFQGGAKALTDYLPEIHNEITARRTNDGIVGLETGLRPLDEGLGGLQKKTITYIGGRPGSMKSTAVGQAAHHVAENGNRVIIASPEMSAEQYTTRWACQSIGLDYDKFTRGLYTEAQEEKLHEAVNMFRHDNIIINESGMQGTASLRQDIIRFKPALLVVDYSQLFEPTNATYNEYVDVTRFSKELNSMKKDFLIPILAAVQLSRKVEEREDKRPIKSDIRASGQIEQDADAIYMLYNEREYATMDELGVWWIQKKGEDGEKEVDPNVLEWVSAKNRHGRRDDYLTYTKDGDIWIYNERQKQPTKAA